MMEDPAVAVTTAASGSPRVDSFQSSTTRTGRRGGDHVVEPVVAVHHPRRPHLRNDVAARAAVHLSRTGSSRVRDCSSCRCQRRSSRCR